MQNLSAEVTHEDATVVDKGKNHCAHKITYTHPTTDHHNTRPTHKAAVVRATGMQHAHHMQTQLHAAHHHQLPHVFLLHYVFLHTCHFWNKNSKMRSTTGMLHLSPRLAIAVNQ
jgi:hypothetical protein